MKSKQIRIQFLDFFRQKEHKIIPSAPIVLKEDPTLMFTNAGMNPFKEYFLGQKTSKQARIADTQKCLRVCGKHNDLEEVGKDTYHHTMFEMLGNWSFGDYFKKEAIQWAWELLTKVFKIDKKNLYVTIFGGSQEDKLPLDEAAYDFWKEIISEDRIILGSKKDNFWEMGSQGPCGPCSEIHIDLRSKKEKENIFGGDLVNKNHPQVIEIWNLVFMQFNRKSDGNLELLPSKHVDTGMGFERLCMVLQGVSSSYDTDIFRPLIQKISAITSVSYGKKEETDIAIRVIADHVRAVCFTVADGQLPANTGAGYVIRRILRRAIRYGFTFLNQKKPFIFKLVSVLEEQMGEAFPELQREKDLIIKVIKQEEASFLKTLGQGLQLLDKIVQERESDVICGKKVFKLYDTFGFPIDLTALILEEKGLSLDYKTFKNALQEQKNRSKTASEIHTDDWVILDDSTVKTSFIGYDALQSETKILRYRKVNNKKIGDYYQLVFDTTPFYAESGGQIGDRGLLSEGQEQIPIFDTKKEHNLWVHLTKKLPKNINNTFTAVVDKEFRFSNSCNHSATHLLHEALREVLGRHVTQKGSLIQDKSLRFDFAHFNKITPTALQQIETLVNEKIQQKIDLEEHRSIPLQTALNSGAMALFGEKYGDKVRMICFGNSKELCGGTHVQNTGDLWHFKIVSEGAIAAGVRRIEAITCQAVRIYFKEKENVLERIKATLNKNTDIVKAIATLQKENTSLKKQMESLIKEKIQSLKTHLKNNLIKYNGINFIARQINLEVSASKDLAYALGSEINNLFLLIGVEIDEKAFLICYIDKNLVAQKNLDAGKIVRELGKYIQGSGGGQKFFATAGGKNPKGLKEALKKVKSYIG